jgi:hypothetical protein
MQLLKLQKEDVVLGHLNENNRFNLKSLKSKKYLKNPLTPSFLYITTKFENTFQELYF